MSFADLLAVGDRLARTTLGGPITYAPGVGSPVTVTGIFDEAFQRLELGEAGVRAPGPAAFLTLGDLPSDPATDTACRLTINGKVYAVVDPVKDGQGGVVCHLRRTS